MIALGATFEKHSDEFLKFERVENPRHQRPDLCAFLMLHDLSPMPPLRGSGSMARDMVSAAEHDEIFLDVDCNTLAMNATEADIVTLIRCGVRFSEEYDSLCMFV